jgi:hypothetical protein
MTIDRPGALGSGQNQRSLSGASARYLRIARQFVMSDEQRLQMATRAWMRLAG